MWRHFTSRGPGTSGNICAGLRGSFRVPRSLSSRVSSNDAQLAVYFTYQMPIL